ncbi:MAG: hypothetical protein ABSA91_19190 [Acidimicrobiales bacterium]
MRHTVFLPTQLVADVERRAAASARPEDVEYGRLLALGLLAKLAEELAPLFPELRQSALPAQTKKRSGHRPGAFPTGDVPVLNSRSIPAAGATDPVGGNGPP